MSNTITLNPFTRIEGHQVNIDGGRVTNAFISGEMFRGLEIILRGRSPWTRSTSLSGFAACVRWTCRLLPKIAKNEI